MHRVRRHCHIERVGCHRDDVRALARSERAGLLVPADDACGIDGRQFQRAPRGQLELAARPPVLHRHSEFQHCEQIDVAGKRARVDAKANRHAALMNSLISGKPQPPRISVCGSMLIDAPESFTILISSALAEHPCTMLTSGPSRPCLAWPSICPCVAAFTVPICTVIGRPRPPRGVELGFVNLRRQVGVAPIDAAPGHAERHEALVRIAPPVLVHCRQFGEQNGLIRRLVDRLAERPAAAQAYVVDARRSASACARLRML